LLLCFFVSLLLCFFVSLLLCCLLAQNAKWRDSNGMKKKKECDNE
jgi:cytochrome c biogenesis protein ResB